MRISDWSSDVCSSDLVGSRRPAGHPAEPAGGRQLRAFGVRGEPAQQPRLSGVHAAEPGGRDPRRERAADHGGPGAAHPRRDDHLSQQPDAERPRSEEHTSELQSLMRISYAVFCLKKKTHKTKQTQNNQQNKETKQIVRMNNTKQ